MALVGRTNVGKSTLFNRLIEESKAIVSSVAGTTRDRNFGTCRWAGRVLTIVDTGGLDVANKDVIEKNVIAQAKKAIAEADVILFVVDAVSGPLPQERDLSRELFQSKKPVILVANKADNPRVRRRITKDSWERLARGVPHAVSATNGSGIGDLLDVVVAKIKETETVPTEPPIAIAIVGKPNVGKSTLTNALLGEDRVIVSPIAGTTREPQDTLVLYDGKPFLLIDTVGLRKRANIEPGLEKVGVRKTLGVIERADVIFFVVDLTEELGSQDRHIARLVEESGKAVVIVGNKWDAIGKKDAKALARREEQLRTEELQGIDYALVRVISAERGQRVDALFQDALTAKAHWEFEINDKWLDAFFRKTIAHEKKFGGVKHPYIYKLRQSGTQPPTFHLTIKAKREEGALPEAYLRFFERRMREMWDFTGTPVRIVAKHIELTPSRI